LLYIISYNVPWIILQTRELFYLQLLSILIVLVFRNFNEGAPLFLPEFRKLVNKWPISVSPRNTRLLHNGSANPCRRARRLVTTVSPNAIVRIAVASAWRNNKPKRYFSKRGSTYF